MKARTLALLCLLTLLPACNGLSTSDSRGGSSPVATLECMAAIPPIPGFHEVSRDTVPQGGIAGLRIYYQAKAGQRLVYTSGVLTDMFETAPVVDGLKLSWGGTASLFQQGKNRWILFWYEDNACHQYTIGGEGFSRVTFVKMLQDAGVLVKE